MKKLNFVQKPFLTIIVLVFVVAAILYIESQKPDLSKAKQIQTQENGKLSPSPAKTSLNYSKTETINNSVQLQRNMFDAAGLYFYQVQFSTGFRQQGKLVVE